MPTTDAHSRRGAPPRALAAVRVVVIVGCLALAASGAIAATALGAPATKVVTYRGFRVTVPTTWPVYRLARRATTCVRFDRHAVYLGAPGPDQSCPAHVAGRTEAILVSPANVPDPLPTGGSGTQLTETAHHVEVTATWDRQPALIRRALGVRSLAAAAAASARPPAASPLTRAVRTMATSAGSATAVASLPGAVYTGLGFDACATPSLSQMSAWNASSYRAIGVYIGGTNMACAQPNLTSAWVGAESTAGWHLVPIYVGLQAPSNSCGCAAMSAGSAASEGTAAASDAVLQAQAVGLGAGNPLYFDMEGYDQSTATSSAVLTFLAAWTSQLHDEGYKSGVYTSADSGIRDLVRQAGAGYAEPDDIWIADWNGARSTTDANVPSADWPSHQRLHQYSGAHNETYGGTTINIDGDYVDAATAAAGMVTTAAAAGPSLSITPVADGTVDLYPSWRGAAGISSWQVVAGASPSALSPVATPISVAGRLPIVLTSAYPYAEVRALGSTGQTLGVSPAVPTPPHVSIFGNSVFVPRRGSAAVPVSCFQISACQVTTTIATRTRLAQTGTERVAAGGGLAYVSLSPAAHALVAQAKGHRVAVTITVRTSTGSTATRRLNLVPYTTTGRSPRHQIHSSSSVRILSATDFVANGWSGGVLAACLSPIPCSTRTTLVAAGQVIARPGVQALGAGEAGYLRFRLTPAGHSLLTRSHGNQLAAGLDVTDPTTTASAAITLSSFS